MIISAAKASRAADILGVELTSLTPEGLTVAYRNAAKEHHPDTAKVYDQRKWADVSWAKEALTHWLARRPPVTAEESALSKGDCRSCGGTGRVYVNGQARTLPGKKPLTMMCVMCNGSGTLPTERSQAPGEG